MLERLSCFRPSQIHYFIAALLRQKQYFGLTAKDIKSMARQLATESSASHPFPGIDEKVEWKLFHSFML
jgi:hypothetical protein